MYIAMGDWLLSHPVANVGSRPFFCVYFSCSSLFTVVPEGLLCSTGWCLQNPPLDNHFFSPLYPDRASPTFLNVSNYKQSPTCFCGPFCIPILYEILELVNFVRPMLWCMSAQDPTAAIATSTSAGCMSEHLAVLVGFVLRCHLEAEELADTVRRQNLHTGQVRRSPTYSYILLLRCVFWDSGAVLTKFRADIGADFFYIEASSI